MSIQYGSQTALSLEESLLTYEIALTAPKNYTVESAGQLVQLEETKWTIQENKVTPGRIVLILSDQLHQVSTTVDNYTIDFFVLDPADSLIDSLQVFSKRALKLFEERFGKAESGNNRLKIFFPNLNMESVSNDRYSSNGSFVMLNNQREANVQFRVLSHEIAHFWWRHGILGTYHDFLNEGLAEFSTLMAYQEKYGEERVESIANYYKKKPKVWEALNHGPLRIYNKGSIIYTGRVLW